MLNIWWLIVLGISAYGFYHAVNVLRGGKLNFKPFNCAICLSFWYSLIVILLIDFRLTNIIVMSLFAVGVTDIVKTITDRLTEVKQ